MKVLLELYWTFFVLGGTSFGGGYAMLPVLQRVVVEQKGWALEEELVDYFAIGQCTPGIIAVNVATFIGMKYRGVVGAVVATLGLVSPCLIIISAIAFLFQSVTDSGIFVYGMNGVKSCVAVLILGSAWTLVKKAVVDAWTGRIFYLVFSVMSLGYLFPEVSVLGMLSSPTLLIVVSGVLGVLLAPKKSEPETKGK